MPIYEYACKSCGKVTDTLQKVSDPPPEKCPNCGETGTLQRMVSRTSFVLKGGGWYSDLYGSTKKDSGGSAGSGASSGSGAPASTSSTPAPATPAAAPAPAASAPPTSSSSGGDKK